MRKVLLAAALLLCGSTVWAQGFIRYYPPAGSGGGMTDPGADGIMVRTAADTSSARSITSPAGTLAITNADGVSGNIGIDVDTSIYGQFSSGTETVTGNCTLGDTYLETDANLWSMCTATNTWRTAVTFSEAATTGMGFVIDEDTMSSNSATKVPTQQSVKAYVDANAGGTFDPGTTFTFYDDLTGGTTTASLVGSSGIGFAAVSTGTLTNNIASTAENPGIYRLNSHASNDNSGAILYVSNNGATVGNIGTMWDGHDWSIDVVLKIGSNATAITDAGVWIGLSNNLGTIPGTNGIFIRRDTDLSEGAFAFVVCNSSGGSGCASAADSTNVKVEASTITPSGDVFYRFRIRRLSAGVGGNPTLYFRVNDETEVTFCSSGCTDTLGTVPSGTAMTLVIQYLTRTTTGVISADVDYVSATVSGLDRY